MELLDLRKDLVLDLKKAINIPNLTAQVVVALDYSVSMSSLYSNGSVQNLIERLLPLGLAFDDNGEVDLYLFENGSTKVKENITRSNLSGYVTSKIMNKYRMGGTNYAPVIEEITNKFGSKKKGLFGFGSSSTTLDYPVYVIFITDGENSDKSAAERAIIQASKHGIFFQFVGIGHEQFKFLQKLDDLPGRTIDNANFFKVQDLEKKTDAELYSLLLKEFPFWYKQAKNLNLVK